MNNIVVWNYKVRASNKIVVLKLHNEKLFKLGVETAGSVPTARRMLRRNLATLTRSDLQMISQIEPTDKPEKIKICQGTTFTASTDPSAAGANFALPGIVGFQMYYGTGNNALAGPAHGDISSGCSDNQFPTGQNPTSINFYSDANNIVGMELVFSGGNRISGGPVGIPA